MIFIKFFKRIWSIFSFRRNRNNNNDKNLIQKEEIKYAEKSEIQYDNQDNTTNISNYKFNGTILETFEGVNIVNLEAKSGIYIFKESKNYLYIGQSSNIKRRISEHLNSLKNKELNEHLKKNLKKIFLKIELISQESDKYKINKREKELIEKHNPQFNIQTGGSNNIHENIVKLVEYNGSGEVKSIKSFNDFKKCKVGISGKFYYKNKLIVRTPIVDKIKKKGIDISEKRYSKDTKFWILGKKGTIGNKKLQKIDDNDYVILHDNFINILVKEKILK